MTLGELIKALEAADPDLTVPHGFGNPHSYRGFYDELAFEPREDVTVRQMLDDARSALGHTYHGWKGGEFTMREYTDCWLAVEGDTGEGIGPVLLRYMLAGPQTAAAGPRTWDEVAAQPGVYTIEKHRWYAVVSHAGEVVTVLAATRDGIAEYDSVEAFEAANT